MDAGVGAGDADPVSDAQPRLVTEMIGLATPPRVSVVRIKTATLPRGGLGSFGGFGLPATSRYLGFAPARTIEIKTARALAGLRGFVIR
jgi:hypothetical protein